MFIWIDDNNQKYSIFLCNKEKTTIPELKQILFEITEVSVEKQILTFNNLLLTTETLDDAGIIENSTIFLNREKNLMELNAIDSYHVINKFNEFAPPWREFYIGLNLEGICLNTECDAYDKRVWLTAGLGTFDMKNGINNYCCPICYKNVRNIDACGFYNCKYKITGAQNGSEISMESYAGNFIKYYNSGIAKNNWDTLTFYVW